MAYTVNFKKVRKNVDFRYVVTLHNAANEPVDISQATFEMDVVPKLGTATPVLQLSTANGQLSLFDTGADGRLLINVDHLLMEAVPAGSYKYDLVMIQNGTSRVVMEGSITVKAGVTDI